MHNRARNTCVKVVTNYPEKAVIVRDLSRIIMSPLQVLLLILGPIFITSTNAATPKEVLVGKLPGYLYGQPPRQSDFLTSTFCYCALPDHVPNRKEEAHYFQFEYYNVHSDVTFILEHLCLASSDDKFTCLRPRSVSGKDKGHQDRSEWQGKVCRSWPRDLDIFSVDQFCYLPHENRYSKVDDFIKFNWQKRNVGPGGGQGPASPPQTKVDEVCTGFCKEHTGMPYLDNSKLAPNRIIIYEDMDDMCPLCKMD